MVYFKRAEFWHRTGSRASIRSRGVRKTSSKGRTTLEILEFASTGSKGCYANVQTKKNVARSEAGSGDCAGLNAVIRAAVRTAAALGWEPVGIQ